MGKWEEKRLGEVCEIIAGGTPSTACDEYWNGEISWITPADLSNYNNRYISFGERNISKLGLTKSAAKILPKGTVLLTTRAPIGYVVIAAKELTTNQGFKNLICDNEKVDNRYLYYWLKKNTATLQNFATGATFPEISGSTLKKIKALFPDLPTQTRIADILSTYDDLIENNNRRIELLEKAAQELYKEWFVRFRFPNHENTKFINGLPEGWEFVKIGNAVEIIDGDRGVNYPKQEEFYTDEFCLFLNTGNVTTKGFDFSNLSFITKEKDCALRKGKLKYNDVVLTTRGTVGNCAFYNSRIQYKNMRINSGMVILRNLGIVSPEYIYTVLRYEYLQKVMALYASGSAQPQLPIKDMKRIKIVKPSDEISSAFDKICKEFYNQISLLITKNQNLKRQRDLLLPRLMSGRLEV